jgi:hypothetical protein
VRFVYPPRPQGKLMPGLLDVIERMGIWWAQYKYKGSRNLTYIYPDGTVRLYNRQGEDHKQFALTPAIIDQIRGLRLRKGVGYVLDGELLHAKTTDLKSTLVFYDLLWADDYLLYVRQDARLDVLAEICRNPSHWDTNRRGLVISDNLWLAPVFRDDFASHFRTAASDPVLEGLVLRQPGSRLDSPGARYYEVSWMKRCRKPEGSYLF